MSLKVRTSKALKILLQLSIFVQSHKKLKQLSDDDTELLVFLAARYDKLSPKSFKVLKALHKKYLPEEA